MDTNLTTAAIAPTMHSNTKMSINLLSLENPVFCCYLFWCSILILKMLLMSLVTGVYRFRNKAVSSSEDVNVNKGSEIKADPDVERVRRTENLLQMATSPVTPTVTPTEEISAKMTLNLLSLENPVFCCYLFWCSVLLIKMLLMSLLTGVQRHRKKAVASSEDVNINKGSEVKIDPDVERVRRAHLNDLENILPFLIISLIFITTNPNPIMACTLFRIGSASRIFHTLIYAFWPIPQPARMIAFLITLLVTMFMAVCMAVGTARFI